SQQHEKEKMSTPLNWLGKKIPKCHIYSDTPHNYAPGSAGQSPASSPTTNANAHAAVGPTAAPASPMTRTAPPNYSPSCRAKTASPSTTSSTNSPGPAPKPPMG